MAPLTFSPHPRTFILHPSSLILHPSFAAAPNAVPKLRELILTLAVQGKLVPQDPSDVPGAQLLDEVRAERREAIAARRVSPMKPPARVERGELVCDLPPGWLPVRLAELVMEIQTGPFGSSLHKNDYLLGGTPVINPASLKDGRIEAIDTMAIGPATLKRLEVFKLHAGDIIMARRGEMGRCAVVTKREGGWLCGTGCLVLRMPKALHAPYLAMVIGAPEARRYLGSASVGTTMQNLNQSILARMPVGAPLDEFHSDKSRIIFCSSFRRMMQKAQVFSLEKNTAVRNRLTHSLEVADIGRTIARSIGRELENVKKATHRDTECMQAIVENACLIHDIGNPPFGHFGEEAIKRWFRTNARKTYEKAHRKQRKPEFDAEMVH